VVISFLSGLRANTSVLPAGEVKNWHKIPQEAHSLETFKAPLIFLTVKALVVHLQVTVVEYQVFAIHADY
jgi:hypothetical protein